jgi:hypothetical protein
MVQKELRKFSQWFWKEFLKWYDWWGENGITSKRIFEVEVFFPSQNIDFPFYFKRLLEFFFFLLFFYMCSVSWGLGSFDDIWGENHFLKNFFSNGLTWNSMIITMDIPMVDAYSEMKLCTPIWLNHDYGDGGVLDISAVDAYSRVEVCTPILLGEASKQIWMANHFQNISKYTMDTSLNKA